MSYQMWIPVFNRRWNAKQKEELLALLKAAGCDLALITYERILCDKEMQEKTEENFKENRDFLLSPVIALEGVYTHLDIHNAKGHLEGDRLIIEEDIPPYGFLFFTVSK